MITELFIKQCEKAEEIQERWRHPFKNYIGDLYWKGKKYLMIPEACIFVTEIMFKPDDDHIYLPTQEQLQEIILPVLKKKYNKYYDLVKKDRQANWIFRICNCFLNEHSEIYSNNMNELWLAFIMYQLYNKRWTGKDWITIESVNSPNQKE